MRGVRNNDSHRDVPLLNFKSMNVKQRRLFRLRAAIAELHGAAFVARDDFSKSEDRINLDCIRAPLENVEHAILRELESLGVYKKGYTETNPCDFPEDTQRVADNFKKVISLVKTKT